MLTAYIVGNVIIVASYAVLAILAGTWRVLPYWALIPTFSFFVLCGLTHVELLLHAATGDPLDRSDMSTPSHAIIHVLQGLSAAVGAFGVYRARGPINEVLHLVLSVKDEAAPPTPGGTHEDR